MRNGVFVVRRESAVLYFMMFQFISFRLKQLLPTKIHGSCTQKAWWSSSSAGG